MSNKTMTFGSLFAGIGGLDLGLERAGMVCQFQVEKDEYCRRVLAKHWPDVPKFEDVRDVGGYNLAAVDLIAGGFPCQPHSVAGKRRGKDDDRNLWPEYRRIIEELRPRWVLGENVPGIRTTMLDQVLSDLEDLNYTTGAISVPACAFGSPHIRERLFILAYTNQYDGHRYEVLGGTGSQAITPQPGAGFPTWASWRVIDGQGNRRARWVPDPGICRSFDGVPGGLDRYRALGNAVVPQVAEWIGKRIMVVEMTKGDQP